MLSRVADSLYWMSRYLERAEHTARLLDLNLNLTLDQSSHVAEQRWRLVMSSLRSVEPDVSPCDAYCLTDHLTFNTDNKDSLVSCVTAARENARQARELISSEMWEQLNQLYLQVRHARIEGIYAQPYEFYRPVKEGSYLFQGITDSTMAHGEGWYFIQLGRYIERASATATLLDVNLRALPGSPNQSAGEQDYISWVALLKSCAAFEAYCQTYTADLRPERIAEFLLLNPELPRSVRFAAERIETSLQTVARLTNARQNGRSGRLAGRAERLAGRLRATLDYSQVDEIMADNVHNYLENIQRQCAQIHFVVHQQYIAYSVEAALAR
jgi:uncharacterized alpha-E superfamily protein